MNKEVCGYCKDSDNKLNLNHGSMYHGIIEKNGEERIEVNYHRACWKTLIRRLRMWKRVMA